MKPEVKQKATSIEDIRSIVGHELKAGKEGVKQIADALRLLEGAKIANFTWNYDRVYEKSDCGSVGCAIGWAVELWPSAIKFIQANYRNEWFNGIEAALGVEQASLDTAFANHSLAGHDDVQPHHVADELDRIATTL